MGDSLLLNWIDGFPFLYKPVLTLSYVSSLQAGSSLISNIELFSEFADGLNI